MRTTLNQSRRGFALVWVLVMLLMLIGFVGLALDTGYSFLVSSQLQWGADSAALASAQLVRIDQFDARDAAVDFAAANTAAGEPIQLDANVENAADGDVVFGRYNWVTGVFTPNPETPNAVRVNARRTDAAMGGPVPLIFGPVFGAETINISRMAIAMTDGSSGAGLAVLHPSARGALSVSGTVTLAVEGGGVWVNSTDARAVEFLGTAIIEGDELNVGGGIFMGPNASYTGPEPNLGEPPIADPLAWLPAPPQGPTITDRQLVVTSPQTLPPGFYGGSVIINAHVDLDPGIYYFSNGLTVAGGATINANGSMLYLAGGSLNMNSLARLNLSSPNPEIHNFPGAGTYEGISFFQARTNTSTASLQLSDVADFSGTLYFPSNVVNVQAAGENYLARLIASRLNFSGGGRLIIDYTGANRAAGNKPFLVR